MDEKLVVSVFVPTVEDDGADRGGRGGKIGTGYPVGHDLLLTSRHVVRDEGRDRRHPITIRWWGLPKESESSRVELPIEDDGVVWEGGGELDAILLRCPRPAEVGRGYGIVSEDKPARNLSWESHGFPEAGAYDDDRRAVGFSGNVYPDPDPTNPFELSVEANPLEGQWGGASGMPVFVNKRILGIVRKRPPNYEGARLLATPSWCLIDDQAFRDAIGFDCQKERRSKFRRRLIRALRNALLAAEALADKLDLRDVVVADRPDETATALAEHLLDLDMDLAIRGLRDAHREIRDELEDEGGPELARADTALIDVAQLIVPTLYDHGVIEWVRIQSGEAGPALVFLPAGNHTVAEIIMAGSDRRHTRFRPRQREEDHPAGEFSLPHVPEAGMDATLKKRAEQVRSHLAAKFDPIDVKNFKRDVDGYLAARFLMLDPGRLVVDPARRRSLVADEIANQARDSGWHFYMVFQTPTDPDARQEMEAFVRELKRDYPAIIFLALPNDDDLLRHDRNRFDPFVRMLPTKGKS